MKTFSDNQGRTWTVTINVECIKRVKTLLGVNLLDAIEGELVERLVTDPVLLCDCVYAVCKPEAEARGITDEDFGRAMAGDAIEHACTALLEELVDFFPEPKRRVLAKAIDMDRQTMTSLVLLLAEFNNPESARRPDVITTILKLFDDLSTAQARDVLRVWQRDTALVRALDDVTDDAA